ncbi:MAG: YciI family protein [Vicinamibacterales bacterium]
MRFMMIVKASKDSEAGVLPSERELADMGNFNEQMMNASVMLAGEGLQASSKGARVHFKNGKPTVTDGPFAETKELMAGYWLIRANSKQEAIDWAKRVPFVDGEIEIRQVFELEDFGSNEAIDQHRRHQEELARK